MCKDCVKTRFPQRETLCTETGVYIQNFAGCSKCNEQNRAPDSLISKGKVFIMSTEFDKNFLFSIHWSQKNSTNVSNHWSHEKMSVIKICLLNEKKDWENSDISWHIKLSLSDDKKLYFWVCLKSNAIVVIRGVLASFWKVFIKSCWHGQKFTSAI